MRAVGLGAVGVSSLALLGSCTTMQGSQRYTYYRTPCTTPGAVVATPIAAQPEVARTQMPGAPSSPEASTKSSRTAASGGLGMADPFTLATVATTDALIMARSESVWGSALASAAGTAIAGAVSPVAMPDRGMAPTTVKSLSVRHHILANDAPRRTLQSAIHGSG